MYAYCTGGAIVRTGNPVLSDNAFTGVRPYGDVRDLMTTQGTVNKTGFLLLLVIAVAGWIWQDFFSSAAPNPAAVTTWLVLGAIGGLIAALVTVFKQSWAPVTAPIYALFEGLVIGGMSCLAEFQYPGIVIQAAGLTFGVLLAMLAAYTTGLIKATENFKLGVVAATGGIFIVYMVTTVLGLFGVRVPGIFDNGLVGIGFSLVVVVIAALNLVLDFDFIESGARGGLPKYMEWYAAFGLMVTLIWLYIEILRLLMKLRSRD
jgi:uncharacterized YccA/Bax inhibitor family protein